VRRNGPDQILQHVSGDELIVPPNSISRWGIIADRSWDSRYWGFVRPEAIMGAPIAIYWSARSEDGNVRGMNRSTSRLRGLEGRADPSSGARTDGIESSRSALSEGSAAGFQDSMKRTRFRSRDGGPDFGAAILIVSGVRAAAAGRGSARGRTAWLTARLEQGFGRPSR